MSAKDYEAIAALIKEYGEIATTEQAKMLYWVAIGMVPIFTAGNKRFDADKFMAACGMEGV